MTNRKNNTPDDFSFESVDAGQSIGVPRISLNISHEKRGPNASGYIAINRAALEDTGLKIDDLVEVVADHTREVIAIVKLAKDNGHPGVVKLRVAGGAKSSVKLSSVNVVRLATKRFGYKLGPVPYRMLNAYTILLENNKDAD